MTAAFVCRLHGEAFTHGCPGCEKAQRTLRTLTETIPEVLQAETHDPWTGAPRSTATGCFTTTPNPQVGIEVEVYDPEA